LSGERILLVEDSADVRQFLAESALRPAGYDVLTAANGADGYTLTCDLQPDLIIADHLMPHKTGLEMLAALHDAGMYPPFILITGEGSEALAVEALRLGVSDYLIKPFDVDDLLRAVQHTLNAHWTHQIQQHIPDQLLETNRQLEARLQELGTLVQIGERVTSLLDLQSVLNQVVEAAVYVAQAEKGSLLLVDKSSGELYQYASSNPDQRLDESLRLPVSDSLAGQVVRTGQPLILTGDDLRKITTHYLVRDLAYLPLLRQNEVIGVLEVSNQTETHGGFMSHTLQLLSILADFAAIAVENARLYAATEHERDTLDTILRDTEDMIIVTDTSGTVMFCNPAACRTFEIPPPGCQGKPLDAVIHHQEVLELFQKQVRVGRSRSSEIVLEEGHRVLNAQMTVVDQVGKVAVMQDITHLKELDRIKSDFVTTVSHDLRSPLTAILGYVELLSRSGPLNTTQKEFADRIIFSVQSITALITDLLELGKIEAGFDQDREPTQMNLIVRYAIEGQRHLWESKALQLDTKIQDNLPPVLGNPLRLRQLVNNLLENAIKYTPPQGRIGISLDANTDLLLLSVTDTGIGIPQKDQPYIFDKFYRSDMAIDDYSGTGLGLSIVKSIVDQHGGRIWVDSMVGQGSTFTVMLPCNGHTP
jgi:two-component system NtrC family sensor kinase